MVRYFPVLHFRLTQLLTEITCLINNLYNSRPISNSSSFAAQFCSAHLLMLQVLSCLQYVYFAG